MAMEVGDLGHKMQFDWYTTGRDNSDDMANKLLENWQALDADALKGITLALTRFKLYQEWSKEHDRQFLTQTCEEHFEVPLTTPQGRPYLLEGYIDRSSIDRIGNLWIEDYKWTSRFWSPIELMMDPQLVFYAAALRTLGRPVHGTMITQVSTYPYATSTLKSKKLEDLIKREKIYRSPQELDSVLWEIGLKVDDLIEKRENPGQPRSLRRECDRCQWQEPCLMGLKGIDPLDYIAASGAFKKKEGRPDSDANRHDVMTTRLLEVNKLEIEIFDEPI